jgi:cytochrome c oxidase subunit 2
LGRPRILVPLLGVAVVATAILAAPAQASVISPRAAHSPNAEDIRTAYWVTLAVATLLFIAVNAGLVMAVMRFRAGRDRTPARFVAGRGVFARASVPLAAIAAGLFVFGIVMAEKARDVQPSGPDGLAASAGLTAQAGGLSPAPTDQGSVIDINAVAQEWLWRFEYPVGSPGPPYEVFSYGELVVPVDTTVILHIDSTDVTHRWFVPALGGQVDAVPGHISETWFRADHVGVYPGQSTAYSGANYPAMRTWVKVVSPDEYQAFLDQKKSEIASAQEFVQKKIDAGATVGGVTEP